ncbi:hypothetical protein [Halothece sp. PCC 7418]|nr:hypothetical protein [Halothece sp. PCC 7418]
MAHENSTSPIAQIGKNSLPLDNWRFQLTARGKTALSVFLGIVIN